MYQYIFIFFLYAVCVVCDNKVEKNVNDEQFLTAVCYYFKLFCPHNITNTDE